jgi:hypothetical protein
MAFEIFGFTIGKKRLDGTSELSPPQPQIISPDKYDGAYVVETGGVQGTMVDFSGAVRDENALIQQFRSMSIYSEVDRAIDDIVNDSIVPGTNKRPVKLMMDNVQLSDPIKTKIQGEFFYILTLLDFNNRGYDIFRKWYIDSKLYYYIQIDDKNPQRGILDLIPIDPIKIKKVRKIEKERRRVDPNVNVVMPVVKKMEEYYIYTDTDREALIPTSPTGVKFAIDSICYVHSGIIDASTRKVVGYLQKAIRPLNMLRQIEDSVVIYRVARAPERRVFYVDVGNLPKQKAEQYVRDIMNRYRNKIVYDPASGTIKDDRNFQSMLEDFWMPRREGGRGTEISSLPSGSNLGDMTDVEYFQRKLWQALNVPLSRMVSEGSMFNMGRAAEITRDEVKFYKFIDRLRNRFSALFMNLLKTQLILKGIISEEDWMSISQDLGFNFNRDSYFDELKEAEILRERIEALGSVDPLVGKYFSQEYIRKTLLKQDDQDIVRMNAEMEQERAIEQERMMQEQLMQQQMMPPPPPGQQGQRGNAQRPS